MSSALDSIRLRIRSGTPEETPEGLMVVVYDGRRGTRLVVDPETGRAVATNNGHSQTVVHRQDPALAAMRALSGVLTGGVS